MSAKKPVSKKATSRKKAAPRAAASKAQASASKKTAATSKPDEMEPDVLEFIQAIDDYKRQEGRPFPSWSEILEIVKELGYERRT